ncbi:hypothetical protein D3C75_711380 [compost metagenome]
MVALVNHLHHRQLFRCRIPVNRAVNRHLQPGILLELQQLLQICLRQLLLAGDILDQPVQLLLLLRA